MKSPVILLATIRTVFTLYADVETLRLGIIALGASANDERITFNYSQLQRQSLEAVKKIHEKKINAHWRIFRHAHSMEANRGRDKLKILHWDKTGLVLWYKRLKRS